MPWVTCMLRETSNEVASGLETRVFPLIELCQQAVRLVWDRQLMSTTVAIFKG